jgi:flagellar hook-associated protein 3 FlgL
MITGTRHRLTMEINRQLNLGREIARGQTEISTGKRIQAPSDDPVAAARVSEIARSQANETVWKSNLNLAASLAARADTALASADSALDRAGELMVAGANGTLSALDRSVIAGELRAIAEELAALKDVRDSRGNRIFMSGVSLQIPVASGLAVSAVDTREATFESVDTAAGPQDVVAIVTAAAAALELADPVARAAAVAVSIDEVADAAGHIGNMRGQHGALAARIDQLLERQANTSLQLDEERKGLESADITAVIAKLQSQQLTLQAAQAVFARVNSQTLFDVLR